MPIAAWRNARSNSSPWSTPAVTPSSVQSEVRAASTKEAFMNQVTSTSAHDTRLVWLTRAFASWQRRSGNMTRIGTRFRGPPESANGGYCAGILADALAGAVEVTLRRPPPLEQELELRVEPERA